MRSFRLVERDVEPGCCEIAVEGELDLPVAEELKRALERAIPEHDCVLIDLRDCEFIDSTGIALLVDAHHRMCSHGGRLALYGASGQVQRVFAISGIAENGLLFQSREEAKAAPGAASDS